MTLRFGASYSRVFPLMRATSDEGVFTVVFMDDVGVPFRDYIACRACAFREAPGNCLFYTPVGAAPCRARVDSRRAAGHPGHGPTPGSPSRQGGVPRRPFPAGRHFETRVITFGRRIRYATHMRTHAISSVPASIVDGIPGGGISECEDARYELSVSVALLRTEDLRAAVRARPPLRRR